MSTRARVWVLLFLWAAGCAPTVPPELTLNRERLDFGDVEIGGTYRLGVVLSNPGTTALRMSELRLEPPLPELALEGLPIDEIPPESWELLTVVYRPTGEGQLSASVRLEAADGKGPRDLPLEGSVVHLSAVIRAEPGASCSGLAGSLDFGTVFNGDGGVRVFTVESTGTGTLWLRKAIASPADAGFIVEGAPLSLAPGETGTFTVRYDPTLAGPQRGAITLLTNSFVLPRIEVPICSTAMVSALCVTPAVLSFGDVAPASSGTGQVTVSNCGNLPATLESASIIPDPTAASGFSLPVPVSPAVLGAGENTTLDVRFDSTTTRTARSQLRLTSSSLVTPELFVPMGANLPPPCNPKLSVQSLQFYKELAPTQSVRLTNSSASDCLIERLDIVPAGSHFALVRPLVLPTVLAARSSMEFAINYAPPSTAMTATTARLQLELQWVHEVILRGDPRPPPGCHLVPRSPSLDFGLTGGAASKTLVLANVGAGTCRLNGVTFDQPAFSVVYASTLIPAQTQASLTVSYVAGQSTATSASMTISSNDLDQPQLVVPILIGHVRCDPNCDCTAAQTPAYWRFEPRGSSLAPYSGTLGAFQQSCDPKRCPTGQVSVEIDYGVTQCIAPPPTCSGGQGLELTNNAEQWACVPCALLVQYGGLYSGMRACAPVPSLSCAPDMTPTFDARLRIWRCVETCNNGAYDQHTLSNGLLVCIPC